MGVLGKKLRGLEGGRVAFYCPGCEEYHQVTVLQVAPRGQERVGPCWGYNGNPDAPTFTPSILVRGVRIQFLGDCTHALSGQTVELPDIGEGAP